MSLLCLRNASTGYGASQVLFGLDLTIEPGQAVALLGRNGMGKTTTLRALFGTLPLHTGSLHFNGHDVTGWLPDRIARLGMALVPEGRQCFPNLTVREHLDAFAARRSGGPAQWNTRTVYELFPRLQERERHMGNQLSGGEQQMLAIGRALVTNPRLLILDEATEGLAPTVREEIWRCLARLREAGQAILVVDKYLERLLPLCERHIVLERGRVIWEGSSQELDRERALWPRLLGV